MEKCRNDALKNNCKSLETIDLPVPYKKVTDEFNQEQLRKIDKILS